MLNRMRKRLSNDSGFTLIELMVVVLIIAVLIAIAIPSFIGFRNKAQDRSAQSELRNVLLAEQAVWTDTTDYSAAQAVLNTYEPTIVIGGTGVTATVCEVVATGEDVAVLEKTSASGSVFGVWASSIDGIYYGSGAAGDSPLVAACNGTVPTSAGTKVWGQGGW
jgi:type IV pilus assembly protein PilA